MPELPEVEITARRLNEALAGARIASATAPGVNTLKTFDPPLSALEGARVEGVSRRGKQLIVRTDSGLALLIHLMSAGRLQLYGEPADTAGAGAGGQWVLPSRATNDPPQSGPGAGSHAPTAGAPGGRA